MPDPVTIRVLSVNTGTPRDVPWEGRVLRTAIEKRPRSGPVPIRFDGLDGDRVANPATHGGPRKTVYAYPSEHYAWWRQELVGVDLPWGAFGENLTLEGVLEGDLRPGDVLAIREARLVVTQPRGPCVNLCARLGRADMIPRFNRSLRSGFYVGVAHEGAVAAGDEVRRERSGPDGPSIAEIFRARVAAD